MCLRAELYILSVLRTRALQTVVMLLFSLQQDTSYNTITQRFARRCLLTVPCHRYSRLDRRAFSVAGPTVWNLLPDKLREWLRLHWGYIHTVTFMRHFARHSSSTSISVFSALEVFTIMRYVNPHFAYLWSPYGIGRPYIFSCCGLFFFLLLLLLSFFSSPNLSRRRLDVCHTSTHGVALVRI